MKGAYGLIFAVFLGLLGGVLNWLYLENKTRDVASVSFLGVAEGVSVAPGQPLNGRHFVEVKIPERHAKNLQDFVYMYEDRVTLEGSPATRSYEGGELVFRADHRTPPAELKLADNEELFWVPVDSRSFVPSLVNPGDRITFIVPVYVNQPARATTATPAVDVTDAAADAVAGPTEEIGPFRVKSLGDRLGTLDVMKASRRAPVQERQIGIVVDTSKPEEVERAKRLRDRLANGDYRNIGIILNARK
ncbi:MAG: hypothetical protein KDB05_26945 [Planctomycetales bacterium]|nr:hypothetical protein [Planctomycetales bacterium]